MPSSHALSASLAFFCALFRTRGAAAAVISVAPGEDTLLTSLSGAGSGDILELADGEYTSSADGTWFFRLGGDSKPTETCCGACPARCVVTIKALNRGKAIIKGSMRWDDTISYYTRQRGMRWDDADVTLDGLKITGFAGSAGATKMDAGNSLIIRCEYVGNYDELIRVEGGNLTVRETLFHHNAASGGLINIKFDWGVPFFVLQDSRMYVALRMSAEILPVHAPLMSPLPNSSRIHPCVETAESADLIHRISRYDNRGTAVSIGEQVSATIERCIFENNHQVVEGNQYEGGPGGVLVRGAAEQLILQSNMFSNNTAGAAHGCHFHVEPGFVNKEGSLSSELRNNTFLTTTSDYWFDLPANFADADYDDMAGVVGAAQQVSCTSSMVMQVLATLPFRCDVGEYAAPAPYMLAAKDFPIIPGTCFYGCAAGYYGNTEFEVERECSGICPIGTSCGEGTVTPAPCAVDTYADSVGSATCSPCPAFSSTLSMSGASSVSACKCGEGYFMQALAGTSFCAQCPVGTSTAVPGATTRAACLCVDGKYLDPTDGQCKACIDGALCTGFGTTLATLDVQPGFWRSSYNSTKISRCPTEDLCRGGNQSCGDLWCSGGDESIIGTACRNGHMGAWCQVCQDNYYLSSGVCQECGGGSEAITLGVPMAVLGVLLLLLYRWLLPQSQKGKKSSWVREKIREKAHKEAKGQALAVADGGASEYAAGLHGAKATDAKGLIKTMTAKWNHHRGKGQSKNDLATHSRILISTVQVISAIGPAFSIPYPSVYQGCFRWLSLLQLDILEFLPLSCFGYVTNHHTVLFIRTLVPLGIVLLVALASYGASKLPESSCCGQASSKLITVAFFIVFLLFPSNSQKIFATFPCTTFDDSAGSQALTADVSIDCDSSLHTSTVSFAYIMIFVWPVGVVSAFAWVIYHRFAKELSTLRQLERKRVAVRADARATLRLDRLQSNESDLHICEDDLPQDVIAQMAKLGEEQKALIAGLPDAVKKLISGYKPTHCGFEIIE